MNTPEFGNHGPDATRPSAIAETRAGQEPGKFVFAPPGLRAGEIAMDDTGIDPTNPGNQTYHEVHRTLTPAAERPGRHKAPYNGQ